jgi:glutamine cyclotransferase
VTNSIWPIRNKVTLLLATAASFASLALLLKVSIPVRSVGAQELQSPSVCGDTVPNPLAVATQRWYVRNSVARFQLQGATNSMAFDGSSMYVLSNAGAGPGVVLNKLRPGDGVITATFSNFGTLEFSSFGSLLFDGQNIWLQYGASDATGAVKLRASDGAVLATFSLAQGSVPLGGMTFDGQDIWISERGSGVHRFPANNIQQTQVFPGGDPVGLASDGHNVWVADASGVVSVRRNSDGNVVHSIPIAGEPWGIAFDGSNMWVTNIGNNTVTKIRAHDFAVLGAFPTQSGPLSITFDGANIWVGNFDSHSVTELRACDGAHLGTFSPGGKPFALAFDGINVWVGINNGVAKM